MEGPHPLPEPEAGQEEPMAGRRCGRHPAQPITGVCSACLVERLASVRSPAHPEIVEVASSSSPRNPDAHSLPVPGSGTQQDQGKLRRTLMLLFQMDDSGADANNQGATRPPDAKDPGASEADHPGGARGSRWKGASWLRAILPRRGPRRRGTKEGEEEEGPSRPSGAADPHPGDVGVGPSPPLAERRASFRRSCEWMICREPPSGRGGASSLDPPRHSWDGSMVGRAFACSFACLDEPSDGVTRVRQSNAGESAGERPAAGVAAESRNGDRAAGVAAESRNGGRHSADVGGDEGQRFSERRSCSDAGPEITAVASGVRRRRSNRWSRVWDRSITSPLKEFVRKGEHALDRSFSESRRETRRCKNGETTDIENGEIHHGRNGSALPGRASQGSSRSSQAAAAANGDAQNFRADWLKNKECRIGRSRSVHYTSPGNFDNGMLRFYLTPMRSNRAANRGRRRSSRLFGRGLFGFV